MSVAPAQTITSSISNYDLAFQVSPIFLQNGIAANVQGGISPIVTYTGGLPSEYDEVFARYIPMASSTLISQSVGMYPFANQSVAANATIQQPLTISLHMIAPVNQPGGYLSKLSTFTSLQNALSQHNAIGGTYIVATPAFVYTSLILISMSDIGEAEEEKQQQIRWQWDFVQPILTVQQAQQSYSTLVQKLSAGSQISTTQVNTSPWTGATSTSPASLTAQTGALGNVTAALSAFGGYL